MRSERGDSMQQTVEKKKGGPKATRNILIIISVLFVVLMLVVPLLSVIWNSLSKGIAFYLQALSTEYVLSALKVTILATVVAVAVHKVGCDDAVGVWQVGIDFGWSFVHLHISDEHNLVASG